MRIIDYFCCILFSTFTFSQVKIASSNPQKIVDMLGSYFKLDRENIHVLFNKDVYVTNEIVGFKEYILSKNSETPNKNTTNVNLVIYDSNKQVVQKRLLFATNGTFSHAIKLDESYKSGIYYFRFYTNWMNNFNEDYSFTQKIEIVNRDEPYIINTKGPVYKTAKVGYFPVSGKIIDNLYIL